jgi:hypothetical protein
MADNNVQSDPLAQEQLIQRHPHHRDPTRLDTERTAEEQSTIRNGGLATGKDTDPVMPADDATLNTKI